MQKKILYLIPRFTTGGAEKLVLAYAKELPKLGYDVAVASLRDGGELAAEFQKIGANILVGNRNYIQTLRRVRAFVRAWQPDIIHTHLFSADVAGWTLKRFFSKQIRWVSTQHNEQSEASYARRLVWQKILQRADRVVAVSEPVAVFCRSWLRRHPERVSTIANGIDLAPWLAVSGANLFAALAVRLAVIGRVEPVKGHEVLLRALSTMANIPWELSIFGSGSAEPRLKRAYRDSPIAKRVHWEGVVTDLPERLRNVDVVMQPSAWEGNSLAVMEAMAAGRVVIASAAAGQGIIEDKKTGLIIPNAAGAVARTILFVLEHPSEARAMAARAREFARRHFSLPRHLQRLVELYG